LTLSGALFPAFKGGAQRHRMGQERFPLMHQDFKGSLLKKIFGFAFGLLFLWAAVSLPQETEESLFKLILKGKPLWVQIARSEEEQARGLMFRGHLGWNEGMLFVYEREQILTFWMKNTPLPLSIAFLDRRGKIVDIQAMEPFSLQVHYSAFPAQYALEVNRGWFMKNGIQVGDAIQIPSLREEDGVKGKK
jgi:uncharacterized membrane protein (UPF0127 family)